MCPGSIKGKDTIMLYREYGKTGIKLSVLGMGSTRFPEEDLNDEAGLERCADIVVAAARLGINYFDIGHNYARSKCEAIYKSAFERLRSLNIPYYSSSKSMSSIDPDADSVLYRAESAVKNLGVEQIDFFYMWSILNEEHYQFIMRKGGPYEGAKKARELGLIKHLVFSSHAPAQTAVKIIEDRVFEGILISFSILNYAELLPVIEAAYREHIGISVMNPLAGGIVPQNPAYFSKLLGAPPEQIIPIAHKFVLAHKGITNLLSGVKSVEEIADNVKETLEAGIPGSDFAAELYDRMTQTSDLCTGCGYCQGCPAGIPIAKYMQAYNMTSLDETGSYYNQSNPDLIKRISVFRRLFLDYHLLPDKKEPVCIQCSKCERACTQHLPIISRLQSVLDMAVKSGATYEQHRERLEQLLYQKNYRRVGFYTGGGYTAYVIGEYKKYFGEPDFEIVILESNPEKWGQKLGEYQIYSPEEILDLNLDCIVITSYKFGDEIYQMLAEYKKNGIKIEKLHKKEDVPWVF